MKKFLLISLGTVFVFIISFFIFIYIVIYFVVHPERSAITETPKDYDLTYETVSFKNIVDYTTLEGWWIPAQDEFFQEKYSKDTIIFAHGFGDSRTSMPIKSLKLAKGLAAEGYNVLMFDFRNSGESEGDTTTIGYYEKYDILSAIEFAKSKESTNIGLLGWSMGASSSILAASESKDVKAVVADSPFSDFKTYIQEQLSYWTKLPNSLSPIVVRTAETVMGLDYNKVSPINVAEEMKETHTSMLLIHGESDGAISYKNSLEIQKKNPDAEVWLIKGAGHIRGYNKEKKHYEEKIIEFFNKNMRANNIPYWKTPEI